MISLEGKTGLVFGIANDRSIAAAIAKQCHDAGATMAFTHLPDADPDRPKARNRCLKVVGDWNPQLVMPCDVSDDAQLDEVFAQVKAEHGRLDFLLHSIAFASLDDLKVPTYQCSRDGFKMAMDISCYSLLALAKRAEPLMTDGGSILALTYIGGERVIPGYNMMGGLQPPHQPSAQPLVTQVHHRAAAVALDRPHRLHQRLVRRLLHVAQHVAQQVLRVHPHQRRPIVVDGVARPVEPTYVAAGQRDVRERVHQRPVGDEVPPPRRVLERHLVQPLDQLVPLHPVVDDLGHRRELEPVGVAQAADRVEPRHRAVGVHHLDAHGRGTQPGEAAEVHHPLGVTRADEGPAVTRPQRLHVPGPVQVRRPGRRIGEHPDRCRPVRRTHAGGHPEPRRRVDRERVRRAPLGRVHRGLGRQLQPIARRPVERDEQHPPPLTQHEVDHLGRGVLGRAHQVPLVLPVLVVDQHDHPAGTQFVEDGGDGVHGLRKVRREPGTGTRR